MNKLKKAYDFVRRKYALLSLKKYTTIAGTLVFFFIMSVVPLAFWLTLLFGRLPFDTRKVLDLPVFYSVKEVLSYIRKEAESATAGASVFLVLTTLYSSTNLFYQMRRSGEIIYEYTSEPRGFFVRLGALLLMACLMAIAILFVGVFAVGTYLFTRIFSRPVAWVLTIVLLFVLSFLLVFFLNIYVCPYRVNVKKFLPGTLVTVVAWTAALIGFRIYLYIGNLSKLYGALSALIVFLLWLYIMMICFIVGVIFNSEKITDGEEKKL